MNWILLLRKASKCGISDQGTRDSEEEDINERLVEIDYKGFKGMK